MGHKINDSGEHSVASHFTFKVCTQASLTIPGETRNKVGESQGAIVFMRLSLTFMFQSNKDERWRKLADILSQTSKTVTKI